MKKICGAQLQLIHCAYLIYKCVLNNTRIYKYIITARRYVLFIVEINMRLYTSCTRRAGTRKRGETGKTIIVLRA